MGGGPGRAFGSVPKAERGQRGRSRSSKRKKNGRIRAYASCVCPPLFVSCDHLTSGEQPYDQAISFANWDTLFFTRDFPAIDADRSVRHVSKVLTYPMTVAAALHQNGPFTTRNGRITREGRRSMAGECSPLTVTL